jgi:hypothetical protein
MGEVNEQRSGFGPLAGSERRAYGRDLSTSRFDWIRVVIGLLLTAGLCWDGWSHTTLGPDQKVFSRYHILFYSSFLARAIWLLANPCGLEAGSTVVADVATGLRPVPARHPSRVLPRGPSCDIVPPAGRLERPVRQHGRLSGASRAPRGAGTRTA